MTGATRGSSSGTPVTEPRSERPALTTLPALPSIGPVVRHLPVRGARQDWQSATVLAIERQTDRMTAFRLALPAGRPHVPGQHMVLRLTAPDGYTAQRSYSITSAPGDGSHIELLVERLDGGEVSGYVHEEIRVGDRLDVRGPFGGWFVWNGNRPAMLFGGGSGVAPLVSMLRAHRDRGASVALRMVVSVRSPQDLPYAREFGDETTVVYTRRTPPGWHRPPGRVDAQTLRSALIPGATAYVCGSSGFAEGTSQLLVEAGVPPGDVRVERYGPTS